MNANSLTRLRVPTQSKSSYRSGKFTQSSKQASINDSTSQHWSMHTNADSNASPGRKLTTYRMLCADPGKSKDMQRIEAASSAGGPGGLGRGRKKLPLVLSSTDSEHVAAANYFSGSQLEGTGAQGTGATSLEGVYQGK